MDDKKQIKHSNKRGLVNPSPNAISEMGKLPPQAIDIEEAVLGALLIDKNALANIIDILHPEAFYKDQLTQAKLNLGITGAMPQKLKQEMFTDLMSLPKGDESRLKIADAPALVGHHATIVEKSAKSTAVSFGFPIDTIRSDKDWTALWLVRSYFGEHRSSNSFLYQSWKSRIRVITVHIFSHFLFCSFN